MPKATLQQDLRQRDERVRHRQEEAVPAAIERPPRRIRAPRSHAIPESPRGHAGGRGGDATGRNQIEEDRTGEHEGGEGAAAAGREGRWLRPERRHVRHPQQPGHSYRRVGGERGGGRRGRGSGVGCL